MITIAWAIVFAACMYYEAPQIKTKDYNNFIVVMIWLFSLIAVIATTIHQW